MFHSFGSEYKHIVTKYVPQKLTTTACFINQEECSGGRHNIYIYIYSLQAIMKRMQSLRLMPSHTYFYKKITQFGKDHDKQILDMVENEGKRMTALGKIDQLQQKEDGKSPITTVTSVSILALLLYT